MEGEEARLLSLRVKRSDAEGQAARKGRGIFHDDDKTRHWQYRLPHMIRLLCGPFGPAAPLPPSRYASDAPSAEPPVENALARSLNSLPRV